MKNKTSTPETASGMDTRVFDHIRLTLNEMFDIDNDKITPDARLYEDLDIDSIDAVDLVVELKSFTGSRINPDDFKAVRTIQDVVDAVERLMKP